MDGEIHKRRAHYSGTHPVKFAEKYKELDPERYSGTVEHVKSKGITPAGMHIPIMADEIMEILHIQPGECGYDATLGYGGHSEKMLKLLGGRGHLYATDVDPEESARTVARLRGLGFGEDIFTLKLMNFSEADVIAAQAGGFDFVLADLGISSMQLDNPERGFSYKTDGPLDLRMNQQDGEPASMRLAAMSEDEIAGMLADNADEPYASEIAHEIVRAGKRGTEIKTTRDLHVLVEKALQFLPRDERAEAGKKSSARVFQALRIDVNGEYEALYSFLEKLPKILRPGGRAAILTFHSGEDRFVKNSFRELEKQGVYSSTAHEVTRASAAECTANSRARSAKLRWAVRSI
jgi:16S rRNA (cytosine1402-N4)-methyltransferase